MLKSGTSASFMYKRCRQCYCWVLQCQEHFFLLFSPSFWFFESCSLKGNKMGFPFLGGVIPWVLSPFFLLPRTWCFAGSVLKCNHSWRVFQLWIWKRIWLQDSPDHWNERTGQYAITLSGELLNKNPTLFEMTWEVFPVVQWLRTRLPVQETWVPGIFHMPQSN